VNQSGKLGGRGWVGGGVVCLLAVLWLQLGLSTYRNSITWDEDDHIYSGYMMWKHADYGLNPEHPPLVKLLAAVPLLGMDIKMPELQQRFFKTEAFQGGKDFLFQNDANAMLFRARMAVSLLTLLLALLVFLAAREMFGTGAGFIALALLAFDPNVLAHGAVVGTDMGLSCFLFAAIYAFYRYVKAPAAGQLIVVGLATGLALAAKHTAILVFPMLLLLAICEVFRSHDESQENKQEGMRHTEQSRWKRVWRLAGALIVIGVIAVGILWAFYGFRYEPRADHMAMNPPYGQFVKELSRPSDVWILSTVAKFKLLPESYLYGLADVRGMADFYTSFLLGKTYPHGVWFYFPVAMAIKSTLTFLILLLVTAWMIATRRLKKWREILFLTIPPAVYLFVAMTAGMNIGLRHVLPVYMFLFVLLAGAAWQLIQSDKRWAYAVLALLAFQAVSGARTFPAYMAYSNELWGGPTQTYKYLSDSNADWGQQLKAVKKYLDAHGVKDCWFVYFADGVVSYQYYGIACKPLPTMDNMWAAEITDVPLEIDGPVLISVGDWSGFEYGPGVLNPYEEFKALKPVAMIDYGVLVYEGHFAVPLAASIGHVQKAERLLEEKKGDEALAEAQTAVELAPWAVDSQAVLGDAYAALGRKDDARTAYEKALELTKNIEPEFAKGRTESVKAKLAAL
jgi:tetratricopeptide (TPR) repeat protein